MYVDVLFRFLCLIILCRVEDAIIYGRITSEVGSYFHTDGVATFVAVNATLGGSIESSVLVVSNSSILPYGIYLHYIAF